MGYTISKENGGVLIEHTNGLYQYTNEDTTVRGNDAEEINTIDIMSSNVSLLAIPPTEFDEIGGAPAAADIPGIVDQLAAVFDKTP